MVKPGLVYLTHLVKSMTQYELTAADVAVETARYRVRQACLRRLPTSPPQEVLVGVGSRRRGDLALFVAREFIRRVHKRASVASWFKGLFGKAPLDAERTGDLPVHFQRS